MATSNAATVEAYIAELPAERREVVSKVRELVRRNLPKGYKRAGKTMDLGKSCLRFKALDDLPLDAVAHVIASTPPEKLIAQYEAVHGKG